MFLKNIKIKSLQKDLMICLGFATMFQELYLDLPDNHYLKVMISCYENDMNKFFQIIRIVIVIMKKMKIEIFLYIYIIKIIWDY